MRNVLFRDFIPLETILNKGCLSFLMGLIIYNGLTRKKEVFKPRNKKNVRVYVCGPTVNDVPHLGHARQQITFDVLRRYLNFLGYNVTFVSNITDIEDKIIDKARKEHISVEELSLKNYAEHMEDYKAIGILPPTIQPKATKFIPEMIDLIQRLERKGYTYVIEGDGVYYDISKFKEYGKLSGQDVKQLEAGARVKLHDKKKNPGDFVLWKFSKEDEPTWNSPWGKGRPGWHIECSAMSSAILGLPLDIHGGGQDLMFPHHEDEIAQSEAAYGKKLARYWMHNGMVNINKVKMSKSLGNFRTVRELLQNYSGEVIRYFVLSSHYRKPIDFTKKALEDAKRSQSRLKNILSELEDDGPANKKYLKEFASAMDDDLNTPKALASLWNLIRDSKAKGKYAAIKKIDGVFGFNLLKKSGVKIPKEIMNLADKRDKARSNKNWKIADKLRMNLAVKGWVIQDTPSGPKIIKTKP